MFQVTLRQHHTEVMLPGERQGGFLRAVQTDVVIARSKPLLPEQS